MRPTDLPEAEAAFTPYLVPMVEVRRLVNEALAMGEEFSLSAWFSQCCFLAKAERCCLADYTKLGSPPLTAPNALTPTDAISAVFQGGGVAQCKDGAAAVCSAEEVELLTKPLPAWALRMLGYFSFPVAPGAESWEELGCVC